LLRKCSGVAPPYEPCYELVPVYLRKVTV
jgi:hypothetical protein